MRLTTDFFVSALTRRVFAVGGFAAILRRGSPEAGALFIVVGAGRLGERTLYGPAPQASYDDERPPDRQFQLMVQGGEFDAIERRLEREAKFDPDHWVVDLDLASGSIEDFVTVTTP